jgi:hypothetical protein
MVPGLDPDENGGRLRPDSARLRKCFRTLLALKQCRISTKNKHLLLSFDTNPRFHGGCFGV